MATKITVYDFKLSNTFEEYCTHIKAPEQQTMFKEMGVKTFFLYRPMKVLSQKGNRYV